jgi:hypothetical protein
MARLATLWKPKNQEDYVKNTLRILLCCSVAFILVTFAAAQDLKVGHITEGPVLPPAAMYTNCGAGCTSYNTGSGYYVSGTANATEQGQVLAVKFATTGVKITKAIAANSGYTTGSPVVNMRGMLLKNASGLPAGAVAGGTLTVVGTCPPATGSASCTYKPAKPVATIKGRAMWLCLFMSKAHQSDVDLWMESNSDISKGGPPYNFAFINGSTSTGTCLNEPWIGVPASDGLVRAAFEIN